MRRVSIVRSAILLLWVALTGWVAFVCWRHISPAPRITPTVAPPFKPPVDARTKAYAEFRAEDDKWLEERGVFARSCMEEKGVPLFTFNMRLFCISRSAVIGGGAHGMPDRSPPELP